MRHVILTGEVGIGKSTVIKRTLHLLGVHAEGIQTGAYEPRDAREKTLFLRAYGDDAKGCPFAQLPGGDKAYAARCFDAVGAHLLRRARRRGEMIVIDELGWLERDAAVYQQELRSTLDGSVPVLAVLRKNKTEWADWIRARSDVALLTAREQNRDELPEQIAEVLRLQIKKRETEESLMDVPVCYELQEHEMKHQR